MTCDTKYPILLLHGLGFTDRLPIHYYWGRIPRYLRNRGARVYFGNQDGNATIAENARRLIPHIRRILAETGAEKVNIIAHSKGGLEARYLVSSLHMGHLVASITTLGTPHHGSGTIDALLERYCCVIRTGSRAVDLGRRLLGDRNPHTYVAVRQLTTSYMRRFNAFNPDDPQVYYRSYAFVMRSAGSDPILSIPYLFVKYWEGENDGMVTPKNARWSNFQGICRGSAGRGVSHADVVDLKRRPVSLRLPDDGGVLTDITRLYIQIVSDLKERGF